MTIDILERPVTQEAAADAPELLDLGDVQISRAEVADVELFLASERGKAWLKRRTDGAYFTMWYNHNRSPYEVKWCNELAEAILEAKREGRHDEVHDVVEGKFSGGHGAEETYDEEHERDVANALEEMAGALDELREDDPTIPEIDIEAWADTLRECITQHMYDEDDSTVLDMFGSYDRCELIIRLGGEVYSGNAWADFDNLVIDDGLQKALYAMGYTVADYRRMSGNGNPGQGLARGLRKRPQPLLSEQEMRSLVNETTSSNWRFVLYAMVPVRDLVNLDLDAPISLSSYSIGAYNSGSGTYYDIKRDQSITLMPGEGELRGPGRYGPKEICDMGTRYHEADIANVAA